MVVTSASSTTSSCGTTCRSRILSGALARRHGDLGAEDPATLTLSRWVFLVRHVESGRHPCIEETAMLSTPRTPPESADLRLSRALSRTRMDAHLWRTSLPSSYVWTTRTAAPP